MSTASRKRSRSRRRRRSRRSSGGFGRLVVAAIALGVLAIIGNAVAPSAGGGSYGPVPTVSTQAHSAVAHKLPPHKLPFKGLVKSLTGQGNTQQGNGGGDQQADQQADPGA